MNDLLGFWLDSLPDLLDGLIVSLQVTGAALAIGFPLGLLLALGVQSKARLINLASLCVVEIGRGAPALVVLITHETTEEAIRQAIDAIERDGKVSERPQMIRIEKLSEDA